MLYYWYRIARILTLRKFQKPLNIEAELNRQFRVRLFDCDGLRVLAAFKYSTYMDFIRWELVARTRLYKEIAKTGFAPSLGSQKIIYRTPLKLWSKFNIRLETAGWDEKWIYHVHYFEQHSQVKAIGVTRALIWKKDKPQLLREILENAGVSDLDRRPADWVVNLFKADNAIVGFGNHGRVVEPLLKAI